jgi:hypothetical protein
MVCHHACVPPLGGAARFKSGAYRAAWGASRMAVVLKSSEVHDGFTLVVLRGVYWRLMQSLEVQAYIGDVAAALVKTAHIVLSLLSLAKIPTRSSGIS